MNRTLIGLGVCLVVIGVLWPWLTKFGWGRLPGDIVITRGNGRFYFPLTTCLLISAALSLILWLWRR